MVSLSLVTLMLAAASAAVAAPVPAASTAAAQGQPPRAGRTPRPNFATIDISKTAGGGKASLAAAKLKCPDTLTPEQLMAAHDSAENAELKHFDPAIKAATSKARLAALQCQFKRNQLLKNFCHNRASVKVGDKDGVTLTEKRLKANSAGVDKLCKNVDTTLFI
nr:hypothetical protein HK105_008241 [Polyrhizophydium stewartii]